MLIKSKFMKPEKQMNIDKYGVITHVVLQNIISKSEQAFNIFGNDYIFATLLQQSPYKKIGKF